MISLAALNRRLEMPSSSKPPATGIGRSSTLPRNMGSKSTIVPPGIARGKISTPPVSKKVSMLLRRVRLDEQFIRAFCESESSS
jgi:hypothetical protein